MQIGKAARSNRSHIKSRVKMEPHGVFKKVTKQCTNKFWGGARFARPFYYRVLGFASARTLRVRFVYAQAIGFQLGKSGLMQCRALELFTRKKTSSEPIKQRTTQSLPKEEEEEEEFT